MKTKNKTEKQTPVVAPTLARFKDPEAELLITKTVADINATVVEEATELASLGKPGINESGLYLYTETVSKAYQSLLEGVNTKLGAESAKSEGASFKIESEREEEELHQSIHDTEHILRDDRKKLAQCDAGLGGILRTWRIIIVCLVVIGLGELMLNTGAFLLLTEGSFLRAVLAASTVSVLLIAIPHLVERSTRTLSNPFQKWTVVVLYSVGISALLYVLADLRMSFLTDSGKTISDAVTPHHFVIVNMVMFLASVLLTIYFHPAKGTREKHEEYLIQKKKVAELVAELKKTKERLKTLPKERDAQLAKYYGILLMAKNYEQLIEAHHQESLALWIKTNLLRRQPERDGGSPKMFTTEPRPTLTTYFNNFY